MKKKKKKIHLGIDEYHFKQNEVVILITNLSKKTIKTILPDDRKETLKKALLNIPEEVKVKIPEVCCVCCDMKNTFIQAIKEALPSALIVLDHFHIIQECQ